MSATFSILKQIGCIKNDNIPCNFWHPKGWISTQSILDSIWTFVRLNICTLTLHSLYQLFQKTTNIVQYSWRMFIEDLRFNSYEWLQSTNEEERCQLQKLKNCHISYVYNIQFAMLYISVAKDIFWNNYQGKNHFSHLRTVRNIALQSNTKLCSWGKCIKKHFQNINIFDMIAP